MMCETKSTRALTVLLAALLGTALLGTACSGETAPPDAGAGRDASTGADAATPDAGPPGDDAGAVADGGAPSEDAGGPVSCPGAVCGSVTYAGAYTGAAAPIYIRVYRETGGASFNPTAAVGEPDFSSFREGEGAYQVVVEGYEGNLFVSAFMDVDGSGAEGGPTAGDVLLSGVYSDPMGAYGGYTFEGTPESRPTLIPFTSEGVTGIDITLTDSGVITGTLSGGPAIMGDALVGAFVPAIGGPYLHHIHAGAFSSGLRYFLAIPPGDHWLIRATAGAGGFGYYPRNPPPPPPSNAEPVTVTANELSTGINITLISP